MQREKVQACGWKLWLSLVLWFFLVYVFKPLGVTPHRFSKEAPSGLLFLQTKSMGLLFGMAYLVGITVEQNKAINQLPTNLLFLQSLTS
jgi:hypothetical protein